MKRVINLILGAMGMLTVALISAFISMRLAIHGREVEVPALSNLSLPEAAQMAASRGLRLTLENRFYSASVPPGRILGQSPAPGVKVRREWPVRVTESLGPQEVSIPSLIGQSERPATITLRRLALETGSIAHLPAPGDSGIVLAQSPPPRAEGVDSPSVSLLLSDPNPPESADAFVMPVLTGLTLRSAAARAAASGLRIASAEELRADAAASTQYSSPAAPSPGPAQVLSGQPSAAPGPLAAQGMALPLVVAQSPPSGYRVLRGDAIHITLSR